MLLYMVCFLCLLHYDSNYLCDSFALVTGIPRWQKDVDNVAEVFTVLSLFRIYIVIKIGIL